MGSEMCIRDRIKKAIDAKDYEGEFAGIPVLKYESVLHGEVKKPCLLYTSDAADERSSVDLGGRRIIKKKNVIQCRVSEPTHTKGPTSPT